MLRLNRAELRVASDKEQGRMCGDGDKCSVTRSRLEGIVSEAVKGKGYNIRSSVCVASCSRRTE
eukprot:1048127-Amphidinium_carterae.1